MLILMITAGMIFKNLFLDTGVIFMFLCHWGFCTCCSEVQMIGREMRCGLACRGSTSLALVFLLSLCFQSFFFSLRYSVAKVEGKFGIFWGWMGCQQSLEELSWSVFVCIHVNNSSLNQARENTWSEAWQPSHEHSPSPGGVWVLCKEGSFRLRVVSSESVRWPVLVVSQGVT